MNRIKLPVALLAVAGLAIACSDGTGPAGLQSGLDLATFNIDDFVEVTGDVETVPADAKVYHQTVNFANNLNPCTYFELGTDYGGKIDTGDPGTYTIDGIEVTLEHLGMIGGVHKYAVSVESGYVMTDVFLKHVTDTNEWFHFEPPVQSASGLWTAQQALSHFSVCINDAPVVVLEDLSVEKTAVGSYEREITWDLEKDVNGKANESFSGGPGSLFEWDWNVTATKTISEAGNYKVTGTITITNPNPVPVQVAVADVLSDGTIAEVTCPMNQDDEIWVPAHDGTDDGELVCTYEAYPDDDSAEYNEATVTVLDYEEPEFWDGESTIEGDVATADIDEWTETFVGDDEVTLEDLYLEYSELISATTSESFPDAYTCSEDAEAYENDYYQHTIPNTATLTGDNTDLEATATVVITCAIVWEGETATGAGDTYPGSANWFMYTEHNDEEPTDLIAGQHLLAGHITMSDVGDGWTELTIVLEPGWRWADVEENLKIQDFESAPPAYVQPGAMAHKFTVSDSSVTVTVPTAAYYGIHADVERVVLPD